MVEIIVLGQKSNRVMVKIIVLRQKPNRNNFINVVSWLAGGHYISKTMTK